MVPARLAHVAIITLVSASWEEGNGAVLLLVLFPLLSRRLVSPGGEAGALPPKSPNIHDIEPAIELNTGSLSPPVPATHTNLCAPSKTGMTPAIAPPAPLVDNVADAAEAATPEPTAVADEPAMDADREPTSENAIVAATAALSVEATVCTASGDIDKAVYETCGNDATCCDGSVLLRDSSGAGDDQDILSTTRPCTS